MLYNNANYGRNYFSFKYPDYKVYPTVRLSVPQPLSFCVRLNCNLELLQTTSYLHMKNGLMHMQWLSKECPLLILPYNCKKAMASGKLWKEKVSSIADALVRFIFQTQINKEHQSKMKKNVR